MELLPLVLFMPFLFLAAAYEIRGTHSPNRIVVAATILFAACAYVLPLESVLMRLLAGAVILALGTVATGFRIVGASDAKLLATLMLFVPPQTWILFGLVFSAAMLLALLIVPALRPAHGGAVRARGGTLGTRGMAPMGVTIALAGWLHPVALSLVAVASV